MRWRYISALALLLVIGVAGVLIVLRGEPIHQGRRLSAWLEDLQNPSPVVRKEAQNAVRHIGTNGLPKLREMLHAEDSPLETNIVNVLKRQSWFKMSFPTAREKRIRAALGCIALGSMAKRAVPDLLEFSRCDSFCANMAESALGYIGPEAVEQLGLELNNTNYTRRRVAVGALVFIGPPAKPAIPALINCLKDPYAGVQANAARALGRIGVPSPEIVKSLVECFGDPDVEVRCSAEAAVTEFGNPAIPTLSALLNDPDESIRKGARKALDEMVDASNAQPELIRTNPKRLP
jgi:HEAT repeat protein